ncbi:MAG TPA: outer membrane beta-barrel protein [Opitutaceae bacterium]|nr:outer membrane beta-barrel protein [Opitutaceae bacterium]
MGISRTLRAGLAVFLSLVLVGLPGRALVSIDAGKNQVFVNTSASVTYDSNLFANSAGGGDVMYSMNVEVDYNRHAGLIGLDASIGVNASRFGKYTQENFQNPTIRMDFTKQTGRTTGDLSLSAARQSRADTAANLRDESWFYEANLSLKYPVIERYSLSASLGYSLRDFADNTTLVDLTSYSAGLDLFYVFTTDRDLLAGYHFREDTTSADTKTIDHSFTLGVTGRLIGRLQGTVRAGYELHVPVGGTDGISGLWTANGSAVWNFTKKLNVTGQISKDVSTTSTDTSVDSLSTELDAQYALNSKTIFNVGTGWSHSRFLGRLGGGRVDNAWNWNMALNRTINSHLKASLSYVFSQNWSTIDFSDFSRRAATLSLTSHF